ncbi:MAG TPA: hypothetical protein RMH99_08670, partial [Sandaracinaceae bacterium LLY-WYZ-13_1]|nr:hypothetical protein [Sandaracinaceae bacterium LLY-WYZ-13_1]
MTRAARKRVLVGHALALAAVVVSACGDTTDPNAVPGRRSGRGVGEAAGAAPPPAPAFLPPGHDGLTDEERRRRDR